ncbi:hypothetical protein J6590_105656, partial [Homalodisca vitripennis]
GLCGSTPPADFTVTGQVTLAVRLASHPPSGPHRVDSVSMGGSAVGVAAITSQKSVASEWDR